MEGELYLIEAESDAFRWGRERRWQRQVRRERLHERSAGAEGTRGRVCGRHRWVEEVRREAVQQMRPVAADQREMMQILRILNLNGDRVGEVQRENTRAADDVANADAKGILVYLVGTSEFPFRALVLKALRIPFLCIISSTETMALSSSSEVEAEVSREVD